MGNGSLRFKDNSGNVISFISGSGTDIVISGGTLNLLGMTEVALGNVTISGSTLVNGTQGNQGPQGMNGFQGPTGLQGTTGSNGAQGNQGPTGFQGFQGNQGPTGVQGTTGSQGNQGPTGLQGNQGNQGPTGLQGNQGPTGLQGFQGNQGPTGLQGSQGNQGPTGLQGNQGPQGNTGVSAGITGYTNSGDNRILTSTSATEINAEANLTFDGSTLGVTGAATFSSSVTAAGTMSLDNDGTYGGGYKMLAFTGNANGSHRIFAGTSDDMFFAAATNKGFEFRPNGGTTPAMYITSGGNVGIGTTSPAATLDIVSSGSIQTSILARGLDVNFRLVSRQDKSSNISGSIIGEFGVDYSTTSSTTRNSAIRFHRGGDVTGGFMTFTTNDGSERLRITAAGDVGIGTTTPLSPLSVNASNVKSATGFWHVTLFDNTPMNTGVGGGFTFGGLKSATANEVFAAIDSYKENATSNNAAGTMRFHTQPSDGSGVVERMRITSTGNVGIGTTSPVANLQINSATTSPATMAFSQSVSNTSAQRGGFAFYNSNISTVASIIAQAVTDNVGTDLEFYTRPVGGLLTKNMVILNNGNVLIGTTSDISSTRRELVMRGLNGSVVSLGNNTTADRFQIVSDSGENALLNNKANTPMILYTNNTERMRIKSDGNVGIGTTSPSNARLVIRGAGVSSSTAGLEVANLNGNTTFYVQDNGTSRFFGSSLTETMRVNHDGNVGIGTSSPANILELARASANTQAILTESSDSGQDVALFYSRRSRGTSLSSPTAIQSANFMGGLAIGAYNSSAYAIGAKIYGFTDQTWTTSAQGTNLVFATTSNGTTTVSERMRITSDGEVLVGTTILDVNTQGIQLRNNGIGIFVRSGASCLQLNRLTNDGIIASFRTSDVERGSISISGSNTTYNTTSDYRLKYDFKDYSGLDIVSKIKSYDFAWKEDNKRMYGVIAHELQEILEYTVVGEKDGVDMQGVDYSKLTPILVKAVQELSAQIDILKQEIINLKTN